MTVDLCPMSYVSSSDSSEGTSQWRWNPEAFNREKKREKERKKKKERGRKKAKGREGKGVKKKWERKEEKEGGEPWAITVMYEKVTYEIMS